MESRAVGALLMSYHLKGVFVGSGLEGMCKPAVVAEILRLTAKPDPQVVYLGTATYDSPVARETQTRPLIDAGAQVTPLDVAWDVDDAQKKDAETLLQSADAVVVSGGNTLYAVDRWRLLGIDYMLMAAARRGAVMAGGSAGAICWFSGGHSDSGDPESFRPPSPFSSSSSSSSEDVGGTESEDSKRAWEYVRVPGLSFLPGCLCPHHDRIQSNGLLRSDDFAAMIANNPASTSERGIGLDHYAALVLEGDGSYKILKLGAGGSQKIGDDGRISFTTERDQGHPGVWIVEKAEGAPAGGDAMHVRRTGVPEQGLLSDLLLPASSEGGGSECQEDPKLAEIRTLNPASACAIWSKGDRVI